MATLIKSLLTVLTSSLVLTSAGCLLLSYSSITRLLNYESATKKAAKISNEAAYQLRKTRTTQGAGLVASLVSAVSSFVVLSRTWHGQGSSSLWLCIVSAGAMFGAQKYVAGFWEGSAKVPVGAREYNDAIRATENLCLGLRVGAVLWLGCTLLVMLA